MEVKAKVLEPSEEEKSFHWMIKLLKPDPASGGKNLGRLMNVFDREVHLYEKLLPALNKIGSVKYCHVIFSDLTEGKEALVLEHMKQHGWRDPFNKKAGLNVIKHYMVVAFTTLRALDPK